MCGTGLLNRTTQECVTLVYTMDEGQPNIPNEHGLLPGAVDATGVGGGTWRGVQIHPDAVDNSAMALNREEAANGAWAANAPYSLQDHQGIVRAPAKIPRVLGRMSEFGDQSSLGGEDEDISREQLQMIKARTMFQMIEEIAEDGGGGRKRLLFLTNSQVRTCIHLHVHKYIRAYMHTCTCYR